MNKIKFIYDLIGVIKQKENIKGSFNMTGVKGNTKLFEMNNNNGFHIHYHDDLYFHNSTKLNHENRVNKFKFLFDVLNNIKIEKNQESDYTVSLISNKISEDVKKLLFNIINNQAKEKNDNFYKNFSFEKSSDEFHDFMKQLHKSNNFKLHIKLSVTDKYEVKKSVMEIENPQSRMKLNVNIDLT